MSRLFGDACTSVSDPYLRRACALAERGRGTTSPNPVVGCVLVRDGSIVAEGWHERAGGPHAEAVALAAAGNGARGSTAYVTLEPCAHQGRTPSCADALVQAGVGRVVIGAPDPHPLARGGADALRDAGVDTEFASDPVPFEELVVEWLHFTRTGRPFVRVKVALTLDGHPALAAEQRARISGAEAGLLTMRLRAQADAVMVGVATARIDEPALTVRTQDGALTTRQPRRVLLARSEPPSASLGMLHDGAGLVTLLLPDDTPPDPVVSAACQVLGYPVSGGLVAALSTLGAGGIVSLLVEAGPRLFSALYDEALIDELVVLHGGGIAGADAPALYVGTASIGGAVLVSPLGVTETGRAGTDAVSVWRPRNEHACPDVMDRS